MQPSQVHGWEALGCQSPWRQCRLRHIPRLKWQSPTGMQARVITEICNAFTVLGYTGMISTFTLGHSLSYIGSCISAGGLTSGQSLLLQTSWSDPSTQTAPLWSPQWGLQQHPSNPSSSVSSTLWPWWGGVEQLWSKFDGNNAFINDVLHCVIGVLIHNFIINVRPCMSYVTCLEGDQIHPEGKAESFSAIRSSHACGHLSHRVGRFHPRGDVPKAPIGSCNLVISIVLYRCIQHKPLSN